MSDDQKEPSPPVPHTVTTDAVMAVGILAAVSVTQAIPAEWLATSIVMADFARDWFDDARNETTKETVAARRREIVFAVCALESYLLEWARDILLSKFSAAELLSKLERYFPKGQKKSITDKWKDVPKMLHHDGLIKGTPDLSGQTWKAFRDRVHGCYRNSLIHASVSRPQEKVTASSTPPPDWKAELAKLPAGWAIGIVAELMRGLNDKAGTHTPDWLDKP
jgi:hypothetical protein